MSRVLVDSGIGYLGNIPSEWNIFRIKNAFKCGKKIVNDNWSNTQLLSLTTSGVKEKDIDNPNGKLPDSFDGYQYVEKNNIIMCLFDLDCSAVFSGISKYNGMISPAYKVLECKEMMNPDYAGYYFNYISFDRKYMHYSKNIRYTLNYDEFSSLPMLIPPLEEQKRIASYLDKQCKKINEIINDNNHEIELLEEYKKSLIIKTMKKIDKSDFTKLKYHLRIKSGSYINYSIDTGIYEVYGGGKQIGFADEFNVTENQLLIGRVGANCGQVTYTGKKCFATDNALIVSTDLNPKYTMYLLKMINLNSLNESNAQPLVTASKVCNIKTQICIDEDLEKKVVKFLDKNCEKIDEVINYRKNIIDRLEEYKKSLIYECVTGKREV